MGLEALLGPTATQDRSADASSPTTLPLTDLVAGMYQPRTRMDEGAPRQRGSLRCTTPMR